MLPFLELADMWNATECLAIACAFYPNKKLGSESVLRALVLHRQKASSGLLLPRDCFQKEGVVEGLKARPRSANTVNQLVGSYCWSNSWEMPVFPCVMYPRFHGESHTSQAWKTNHRNWSNRIIKRKVMENKSFSCQDLLETGNESIILLQLREHICPSRPYNCWNMTRCQNTGSSYHQQQTGFSSENLRSWLSYAFICFLRLP